MQGKGLTLQAKEEAPPNRTGMPDHLKSGLENISGIDLSCVHVHYNSSKPKQLNALAYTRGQEIHVAPGQERHLPHEGWHAVQQMQGRVKPTQQMKGGVNINDDVGLEDEATRMGNKAEQMYAQMEIPKENKSRAIANSVAQSKQLKNWQPCIQRLVAQSDWLSIENDGVYTAPKIDGNFKKCNDKTEKAYRDNAEKLLGSLQPVNVLALNNIIPKGERKKEGVLARAHLIAAEYGGQKKYPKSVDNIRYHTQNLEYGEWEMCEKKVKHGSKRYITASSIEDTTNPTERLAKQIVGVISEQLEPEDAQNIKKYLSLELKAVN